MCWLQMSSPVSVLPSVRSKKGWGQQKQASGRRSTRECTSIVEGLKVIYYSKVQCCSHDVMLCLAACV